MEVDISHTDIDIDKIQLYDQMGIPQFWQFNGKAVSLYQLQEGIYQDVPVSPTFPWVSQSVFDHFLAQCKTVGEGPDQLEPRAWVQSHRP